MQKTNKNKKSAHKNTNGHSLDPQSGSLERSTNEYLRPLQIPVPRRFAGYAVVITVNASVGRYRVCVGMQQCFVFALEVLLDC